MTDKTPPSSPLRLRLLGEAAKKAGKVNSDSQMEAAGDPALALAQKAMREGKAGLVTDDKGNFAIVEK